MKPRYVIEYEFDPPSIGHAVVAMWWPGSYYVVSTIACGRYFLTQVAKSDKIGFARWGDATPFYHAEHATKEEALRDHARVVNLMRQGKLKPRPKL